MSNVHALPVQPAAFTGSALTPEGARRLCIDTGRWDLRPQPVSGTPWLTYARELNALERRLGTAFTDRLRWPQRRPRLEAAWPEPECTHPHVHDDVEARVLLAGQARYLVADEAAGSWAVIDCQPGDWIVLPAGLPHLMQASAAAPVDMLRLFTRPRGWLARPAQLAQPRSGEAPVAHDWARAA